MISRDLQLRSYAFGRSFDCAIYLLNTPIPFVGDIFSQLQAAADTRILAEIREGEITGVTGKDCWN